MSAGPSARRFSPLSLEHRFARRAAAERMFLVAALVVGVGCVDAPGTASRDGEHEELTTDEPDPDEAPPVAPPSDAPSPPSPPPPPPPPPPASPPAWGFWDEGFTRVTTRTVYDAQDEGTAANPLQILPCIYRQPDPIFIDPPGCNAGPAVYSASHAWTNAASWPNDDFWVLLMNNEPAFNTCNPGPPDASLPRALPGDGVMGFTVEDLGGAGRAHLVLNNSRPNPCGYAIPFLSIGAHQRRGNHGRALAALHPSDASGAPSHVEFVARLWDINVVDGDVGASYLFAVADWARADGSIVPRMLFVKLGSWSRIPSWEVERAHRHWAWPIAEDPLAPGADIAFLSAEAARQFCGLDVPTLYADDDIELGRTIAYDIDLSAAYDCASRLGLFDEPIPASRDIPVNAVFWANEVARPGSWVWTSVEDMRTSRAACAEGCQPGEQCTRSGCRCGDGPGCGPGRYCGEDYQCYARPHITGEPQCGDLGVAHPAPDYLARYTVFGRPGANVDKYNVHVSCSGSVTQLAPESPLVIGPAGYVTFTVPLEAPLGDCSHAILGRWDSWAVVDGLATEVIPTTYYDSTCSAVRTCALAEGYCPP